MGELKVTALLCDAAQVAEGKLYVLGGGWSIYRSPGRVSMAVAIKIDVPWTDANRKIPFRAELVTEDGMAVTDPDGQPVRLEATLEVGRPPGLPAGTTLDLPLAFRIDIPLAGGGYRWEFFIDDTKATDISFLVLGLQGA